MSEPTRPTSAEILAVLDHAQTAMFAAAGGLLRRYGPMSENAEELIGAAMMIRDNWMPAIQKEAP